MTEIPEHLLKRSKARKAGGDEAAPAGGAASAAVTPAAATAEVPGALAAAAAAIPADKPAVPEAPKPAYVQAFEKRKRIPVWALPVVAALPLWAWAYAGTMQEPVREDALFIESSALYVEKGCSGCHGAGGGGGTGYQLSNGEVVSTFPSVVDQLVHVARGSAAISGEAYGDPARAGGARISGALGAMPAQIDAGLSMLELELVVFHERATLAGEDITAEAYELYAEELRHGAEVGAEEPIDLERLLGCANPIYTPGATGDLPLEECFGPEAAVARAEA